MTNPKESASSESGNHDQKHERKGHLSGYAAVVICSMLFGSVFTMLKPPLESIDPLLLSAIIYLISGLSLLPFAKASFRMRVRRDYFLILAMTVLGAVVAPTLLLYGLERTSASDASILTNGEVLFTIIISSIFFGERPRGKLGILAVVLVTIGLFIVTTDLRLSEAILQLNEGNLMILSAMLFWAIDNNLSRKLAISSDASPSKIAMLKSLYGGLILFAIAAVAGRVGGIVEIEVSMWPIIVSAAIFGFGGALLLFIQGLKRIGTVKTMSVFSTVPIFGIIIAYIFLGEPISATQVVATGIIISGILILSKR